MVAAAGDDQRDGDSLIDKARQMIQPDNKTPLPAADPQVVDQSFKSLSDFTNGRDNRASPLEGIKTDLRELYSYINQLARSGTGAATVGAQQDIAAAVNRIRIAANYAPNPMNDWINDLAAQSEGLIAGKTMSVLNDRWRTEVVPFCQTAIANRYPFLLTGDSEVSLQDWPICFLGGKLDQFFKDNLAAYVNTQSTPWRVRPGVSDVIRINPVVLRQMQLAREIQQAFFVRGGNMPATSFDLKPVGMDPSTTHFMLNMDGQTINYSHGPLVSESLNWPGSSAFSQVQIQFSPATSMGGSRTEAGEWAWFRMLDKSNMQPGGGPEQFRLTFSLADRWITFDLRARSAYNPFNLSQLRSFSCVSSL